MAAANPHRQTEQLTKNQPNLAAPDQPGGCLGGARIGKCITPELSSIVGQGCQDVPGNPRSFHAYPVKTYTHYMWDVS
ncbi:MAG: hypothetical protein WCO00_15980, partial [Rhodospirillaceae bacterium]